MSENDAAGLGGRGDARDEVMSRVALDLACEHDLDGILDRVVVRAAEVTGARYAALGAYDRAGRVERAGLVDGRVEITSEPGRGTTVHLEVPVA